MEAHALAPGLCMPLFSEGVPYRIASHSDSSRDIGTFYAERNAAGLASVLPDANRPETPLEAIQETMVELGLTKSPSEGFIGTVGLAPFTTPFETEEQALGITYCLLLDENRVDTWPLIQRLELAAPGLGETFNWFLKDALKDDVLPGVRHVSSLFDEYREYHYEGCSKEKEIREYLQDAGHSEDDIPNMLPSAIFKALGHKMMVEPRKVLRSKKAVEKALAKAGFEDCEALAQLLTADLKGAVSKVNDALDRIGRVMGWEHGYYSARGRDYWTIGITGEHTLSFFLDHQNYNFGSNGECIDPLLVQRVYLPHGRSQESIDGLDVMCKVVNAIQLVEHTIASFDRALSHRSIT